MISNKFLVDWQITRLRCKNQPLEERIILLKTYFKNNKTIEGRDRILNYLKSIKILKIFNNLIIEDEENTYKILNLEKENIDIENFNIKELTNLSNSFIIDLHIDLYKRNEKWLKKGYYHRDQNLFMDLLLTKLEKIPEKYNREKLFELRLRSSFIKNTYTFIF